MIKTKKINRKNKCGVIIDARKIKTRKKMIKKRREKENQDKIKKD